MKIMKKQPNELQGEKEIRKIKERNRRELRKET
jgi:hypothetical protein